MSINSHPSIRFQQVPIVPGPLSQLESIRPRLLGDVVEQTKDDFLNSGPHLPDLDQLLEEALYLERRRLKKEKCKLFTRGRILGDRKLWSTVQSGLLHSSAESDRTALLETIVHHYAEEIGGHFDPRVYHVATRAVPWGFSWLLNAASVKRFLPWGMTESLGSRLHILGQVPHLQKLAERGTIMLVPTHQSHIDSVLIGYVIYLMSLPPFAYGAGLNLFSNPIMSFFMSRLGSYTVDRQKNNQIYKQTLKNYSTKLLREGMHSIFYPGGGRSRSGAIESRVKLGLLGTALDAQIENLKENKMGSKVFIVPMVISYHCVLEAKSLIEDYLEESGKHRLIMMDDEAWQPTQIIRFFWKFFSSQTGITVRIGRPLDVFGNFVDEEGLSIGPNGTVIDPIRWLTTKNELRREPQRDHEYTRELGMRLSERFHRENTVLSSHLVAFTLFESIRSKYSDFHLFRLVRLSLDQRSLPYSEFLQAIDHYYAKLVELADQGMLFLSEELRSSREVWLADGFKQLGLLHDVAVIKVQNDVVWTDDLKLLYYYRNRLAGYGLSFRASRGRIEPSGSHDAQGFLV